MRTDSMLVISVVFTSLVIVVLTSGLSQVIFRGVASLGPTVVSGFLKAYIKQLKGSRVFFFNFLKYPIFLTSAFIALQLQLMGGIFSGQESLVIVVASMTLYVVAKSLYVSNAGNDSENYFTFLGVLENLFFDLILVTMVFFWSEDLSFQLNFLLFSFFLCNVFLRITSFHVAKCRENRYRIRVQGMCHYTEILDQAVLELGEFIFTLALLFFALGKTILLDMGVAELAGWYLLGHYFKIALFAILAALIIGFSQWILQWMIDKTSLERQVVKVRYLMAPIFLCALVLQLWKQGGL